MNWERAREAHGLCARTGSRQNTWIPRVADGLVDHKAIPDKQHRDRAAITPAP